MPGVAFVAHCLLNQNSRVYDGARCPGIYSPLVEVLRERGWRMEQMPCPEMTFTGMNRFWAVKEQYDTIAFRRHCRRLAAAVGAAAAEHVMAGRPVAFLGIEGSPSMGVCVTSSDPVRGGRPQWPAEGRPELAPGQGIFIEELQAELERRGITDARFGGITSSLPDHVESEQREQLEAILSD